jgi:hypothetical protein
MNPNYPEVAAGLAGAGDENPLEPADGANALPDLQTNWANDPGVVAFIQQYVVPMIAYCKQQRRVLDEEWRTVRRLTLLQHDTGQSYVGRSQAYIPLYARALDNLISQVARGLFPSDEYMDVQRRGDGDPETARPVKEFLQYEFDKVAKLRLMMKPFLRELFNFGLAWGKVWYEPKELAGKTRGRITFDQIANQFNPETYEDYSHEGLRFSPRSVFNCYVYPITISDIREATLVFEDLDFPRQHIQELGRRKLWLNIEDALNAPVDPTHHFNMQTQLAETTGTSQTPVTAPMGENPIGDFRTIQEVWVRLPLPAKAYGAGEDPAQPVLCQIFMAGTKAFAVRRNPNWHGELPYLTCRLDVLPGSFYSKGVGFYSRSLQYLVNDFSNQLNDNGTYALNPIVKINPTSIVGPVPPLKPGAVYSTTDPQNGIVFDRPPGEQLQYGTMLVSLYSTMLSDLGAGMPPSVQGQNAGGNAKTATMGQILQRNAMTPLQDIVEEIENSILNPLMWMTWCLGQQYLSQEIMDSIAGAPIKVSRADLQGDYLFRWLASSQAVNQQQRAQQAITLLQAVQPIVPLLMQLGYIIDPTVLLKRIYTDGFGWRGFDQFIKRAPQGAMGPGGALPPGQGMPGQQGQPNQMSPEQMQGATGNVRSALEQLLGQSNAPQMVPGEGDEFANVRDNADQLAGSYGSVRR